MTTNRTVTMVLILLVLLVLGLPYITYELGRQTSNANTVSITTIDELLFEAEGTKVRIEIKGFHSEISNRELQRLLDLVELSQ